MKLDFIAFAIPFFVFFMLLEFYFSKKRNKKVHQFNESIANINVGIIERMSDLITTGSFFFVFSWLYENYAIFRIDSSIVSWLLLFLATDFVWYWYHRLGHEVNILWASHIVHHQSEDFNYTAAARITVIQAVARGFFWSILPIIGFKPEMITVLLLIHGTYPFFTHTQLVGKLGWLEYVIVTPTHHGVHHSSNPEYLDKNYGDMLIIWDKMFGTYANETLKPVYGITNSLNSYSFLWQHFHYFLELFVAFRLAKTYKEKLAVLFGSPANHDPRIRRLLEIKLLQRNFKISYSTTLITTIQVKTVITICAAFLTILFSNYISDGKMFLIVVYIILSVIITGAMLEQKRWIFHLEFLRVVLLFAFLSSWITLVYLNLFLVVLLMLFIWYYNSINKQYCRLLFC